MRPMDGNFSGLAVGIRWDQVDDLIVRERRSDACDVFERERILFQDAVILFVDIRADQCLFSVLPNTSGKALNFANYFFFIVHTSILH